MRKGTAGKKRLTAGLLATALAVSLIAAIVVLAADPDPTVHIEGLDLRMVAEYETDQYGRYVLDGSNQRIPILDSDGVQKQSVQALVSISISNTELCTGVELPLFYNADYLIPSDWETNGKMEVEVPNSVSVNDPNDPLHHLFFRADEELYEGKDPFDWSGGSSQLLNVKPNITDPDSQKWGMVRGALKLHLTTQRELSDRKDKPEDVTDQNKLVKHEWEWIDSETFEETIENDSYIYTGNDENRTVLGTISFRVNEEYLGTEDVEARLRDLVDKFNGSTTGGPADSSDTKTAPLLQVYGTGQVGALNNPSELKIWGLYKNNDDAFVRRPGDKNVKFRINVESNDVIIKARPVKNQVVINAYEAFTDGKISDLALAMQKYAESVRVTYVSQKEADMSIYWGDPVDTPPSDYMPADGPGMFIQKDGGTDIYRFTWDDTAADGFRFEEKQPDGTFAAVDPTTIYDPRGGVYNISQYFTYWEQDGVPGANNTTGTVVLKTLPIPIEVKLTVVPVKAIGANVDKESLTYLNDILEVPNAFDDLDLAEEARLVLDTTLNDVVPTVPVDWIPDPKPAGWTAGTLDNTVTGTPGVGNPNTDAKWPITNQDFTNKTGIGDYTFKTKVEDTNAAQTGVRDRYPWLTTDPWLNAGNLYAVELSAQRRIVDTDTSADDLASRYVMWAKPVEIPVGSEIAQLQVTIAKVDADGNYEDMLAGYKFRLFMPNGVEIMADVTGTNWFDAASSSYTESGPVGHILPGSTTSHQSYDIFISPGDLNATDGNAIYRETLRRYINLGGWFSAKVLAPGSGIWTDMITSYSEPRTNVYTRSYTVDTATAVSPTDADQHLFDYTGLRAGLMPFRSNSTLSTFVTLPADDSVETRYDGFTGAQPGTMRQFAVDGWTHVLGDKGHTAPAWDGEEIVTYGQDGSGRDIFARHYDYSNFGAVANPDLPAPSSITGYPANIKDRQVVVKVQVPATDPVPDPAKNQDLLLTYEQTGDSITYIENSYGDATAVPPTNYTVNEVKRVTFNNKLEGYTYQQIVTLTLTNAGNTEIRGLYVDIPTLPNADGPYFKLITAPPAVLPAGAKATFQISYVPDLDAGTYENIDATIPVHIWHDDCGTTPAKTFEAVLKVTKGKPHRINLVVRPDVDPEGRIMGDGELVVGVTTNTDNKDVFDGSAAGDTYVAGEVFWVLTTPKDEYELLTAPYYYSKEPELDANGDPVKDNAGNTVYKKVYLDQYPPVLAPGDPEPDLSFQTNAGNGDRNQLFYTTMPDYAITVYVDYYEPLYSKLRLSDLHAYAWDDKSDAKWDGSEPSYEKDLHEPQSGNYQVILFDPKKDEYIVILEDMDSGKDNWCGLSVTLRELETHNNGVDPDLENQDIKPTVEMRLDDGSGTIVGAEPRVGDTVGPTDHHSNIFEAPYEEPGQNTIAQKTVTITISYTGTDLKPVEGKVSRDYKVRFVRKGSGEAKHIALAGNSPYGMIENEGDYSDADKAAAKAAFDVENRFAQDYTPHQAAGLTNIYWPEAWGTGHNYDKDETALFVYLGQEFYDPGVKNIYNNAGDYIDGIEVTRSLTNYYAMDMTQAAAYDRFSNGGMVTTTSIPLGKVPAVKGQIPGVTMTIPQMDGTNKKYDGMVPDFAQVTDIRPGIYRLTYTYTDYDGTTELSFTRPLIILSPNGDVNADLALNNDDASAIRQRFSNALPLELADAVYSDSDKLLYRYRIVDANNDRNINNVDGNLIRRVHSFLAPEKLTEFYRPTEYTCPVEPKP